MRCLETKRALPCAGFKVEYPAGMPRFTSENAREMAARSHAARAAASAPPTPPVNPSASEPQEQYVRRRLNRVRAQIDMLDDRIEKAVRGDSKKLKELTEAQARLSEMERHLAGRPGPGNVHYRAADLRKLKASPSADFGTACLDGPDSPTFTAPR
jgi:hypothetical protein